MLIKKTLFINKVKQKKITQINAILLYLSKVFSASNKSMKNSKQVSPKCNLSYS